MVIVVRQRTRVNAKEWSVLRALTVMMSLTLFIPSPPSTATELGRLFFTPTERSQLDALRDSGEQSIQPTQAEPGSALETVTLNGVMQRKGGTLHSWINGTLNHSDRPLPVFLGREIDSNHALPMEIKGGTNVRPKAGQWFDLKQGKVYENYQKQTLPRATNSPGQHYLEE